MTGFLTFIRNKIVRFFKISSAVARFQAVETIECEVEELENI
jgi:hypothetical protein